MKESFMKKPVMEDLSNKAAQDDFNMDEFLLGLEDSP
jgi:hypothetical protein